jgi:Ca2+-binding RTX toxin-like protein
LGIKGRYVATFYISPTGAGAGDGSSWANAAKISKLPGLIDQAGPGGQVLLRADQGAYNVTTPIIISDGGGAGAPVVVRGADAFGQPMNIEILGNRNMAGGVAGSEVFRLMNGADNLTFENMVFRNVGNGAFRFGADVHDVTLQHMDAYNVVRFVEDYASGSNATATVSNLTVKDVEVHGYSKGAIRLQYNSHDVVIQDVLGDSEKQTYDNFAIGVHLDGTVHNVVLSHVIMANNWNTSSDYWNGDGFATERGVYNIRFEYTASNGNTDAGYDLKSNDTVLDHATADANKRNFRLWGDNITIQDSTGTNPHRYGGSGSQDQVWLAAGAKATILNSVFTDHDPSTTVYNVTEAGAVLTIGGNTVTTDLAATLQRLVSGSTISNTLGLTPATITATTTGDDGVHTVYGTAGADTLDGTAGDDYLRGDLGNDRIAGGGGFDDINGNAGADTASGGAGDDWVVGGKDNDSLSGDDGNDIVYGNLGADTCVGGAGNDLIRGGQDNDSLSGGTGNDWLSGDKGADTISGGAGADIFHGALGSGVDRIVDFSVAEGDRVQLDAGTAYTVGQVGADTVITLGGSDQIVLVGVSMGALPSGWIFSA